MATSADVMSLDVAAPQAAAAAAPRPPIALSFAPE